jgi:hypothetical protein
MKNSVIIAAIFMVVQINVHATLGNRSQHQLQLNGQHLIKDTALSLEWTRDANPAKTLCENMDPLWTSFDPGQAKDNTGRSTGEICAQDGRMNWHEAKAWLRHLNANRYLGHDNWRLPEISYQDSSCSDQVVFNRTGMTVALGSGCMNSEPGNMKSAQSDYQNSLKNLDDQLFWSETELAADSNLVGVFGIKNDWQDAEGKNSDLLHVWPVHSL